MKLRTDNTNVPLAIIGMACRLPGAENLDAYWRLIVEGRTPIAEVPADRLDQELYYDPQRGTRGKTYSRLAALLADRRFDESRCPLPEELLKSVDNTHLLMTGVAADALRHARLDPFNLPLRNTAVFIGHAQGSSRLGELTFEAYLDDALALLEETAGFAELPAVERAAIRREAGEQLRRRLPGKQANARNLFCNMVSGTVARAFGLSGPWLALNSACASSLHAMLMGARALQLGRADMAIVGGASDCKGDSLVLFSAAQAMSATGSRPFDADADGLIMSEGYVCLVMKTLSRALADGDPIQAVVRGLGLATDGRGKSLWAPRKEGQIKAMQRAYRSGVDLSKVQYLECHATATQLGDATELETLGEVLGPTFPAGKRIPITSAKASIGHSLEAAGVAGMIKTVLCMQHQTVPPAVGVRSLNPKVDWQSAPYYVPMQPETWQPQPDGSPRRAAVNAFGIGGLNMHVVIDEFTPAAKQLATSLPPQTSATPDDSAVAIVGMGCIFPGAIGLAKLWESLLAGNDPKSAPPSSRWTQRALAERTAAGRPVVGGFVTGYEYDWRKHKVPPKQVQEADPLQFMLLDATEQALNDAGFDKKPLDRERCGVAVGTEFGGDFCDELELGLRLPEMQARLAPLLAQRGVTGEKIAAINEKFAATLLKKYPSLVDETGSFTSSTLASRISKTLDLAGGAVSIDSGSTAALSALTICIDTLLSGDNDVMICAAGQRRMGLTAFNALDNAGLGAQSGGKHLLDAGYDGIAPAEGVGAVVLKRLADARRDGDRIHAIIRGVGVANHDSASSALELACQRACAASGVDPSEISLVELNTDERISPAADELKTIATEHLRPARQTPLTLGSSAAQFGHLGGGAGMAALIAASLEVENARAASPVALAQLSPALAPWAKQIQVARTAAKMSERPLASVACWSKGQAFHVILEHGSAPPRTQKAPRVVAQSIPAAGAIALVASAGPRICRFGAATLPALLATTESARQDPSAAWDAASKVAFGASDHFRLAIVAESAAALGRKFQLALPQLQNAAVRAVLEQQGVFFQEIPARRPRVAFVFPGQGSQYDGMLRELVRDVPAAAAQLAEVDAAMTHLGYPTLSQLAWEAPTRLGSDVWTTQVALLLADTVVHAALTDCGITADLVLGHSYGEFPALLAAGVWDIETAIRMTRARCEGIDSLANTNDGMLATSATPQQVESVGERLGVQVYLANLNAPDQAVFGGKRTDLELLAESLEKQALPARLLAVPAAFHTPLMAGASSKLSAALQTASLQAPRLPIYSTVTNQAVTSPAEVRVNLAAQLTAPVRYAQLITNLAAIEPTVLIEVGPGQTLTRLNRRILGTSAQTISADNPKRPGLETLLFVQAWAECLGISGAGQLPRPATTSATAKATISFTTTETRAMDDQIPHFDATERRRAKMRGEGAAKTAATALAPQTNGHTAVHTNGNGNGHAYSNGNGNSHEVTPQTPRVPTPPRFATPAAPAESVAPALHVSTPPPVQAAKPVAPEAPSPPAVPVLAPVAAKVNVGELESFLINFVVEQTGYPPEVVELDADLEADLGIDSIKKAQLFGELQEYFDVSTAASNLSLDEFPTLRHVLNFLKASATPSSAAAPPSQPPVAPLATTPSTVAPAALPVAPAVETSPTAQSKVNPDELESFLINFVVEQTGYPPEVVELDADLEADLGIDSIKKAQLFGELQEYFDIGASASNLSLDDFPTLRHVLNFLAQNTAPAASAAPTHAAPAAATPPPPTLVPPSVAPSTQTAAQASGADLEAFLINFVVEQTGYPPEVVELDADLEADLGIDSIKKAQLFGELQEYFDVGTAVSTLSLDDFPTLRHVLNFLSQSTAAAPAAGNLNQLSATADPAPSVAPVHTNAPATLTGSTATAAHIAAATSGLTPYEAGFQQGLAIKGQIHRALRQYIELAGETYDELPAPDELPRPERLLSPGELDQLQGLADAAEVPLANLLAYQFAVASSECFTGSAESPPPNSVVARAASQGALAGDSTAVADARASSLTFGVPAAAEGLTLPWTLLPSASEAEDVTSDTPLVTLPQPSVAARFVLRMQDAPLPPAAFGEPTWTGAAIVVGDNATAQALGDRLKRCGVVVHRLPAAPSVSDEAILAELNRICELGPAPHLFITTPRDDQPTSPRDEAMWLRQRRESMLLPFLIVQKWVALAAQGRWLDRATLVATTAMGGDFGFARGTAAAHGGALAGLLKAVFIEYTVMQGLGDLRVKVLDAPADTASDEVVQNVFRELASGNLDYEVAYVDGTRRVPFAVERPVETSCGRQHGIRPGGTWVITGGARGITAACALELGRRYGLRLHLIGASPLPQIDPTHRNLSVDELQKLKAATMIAARQAGQPAAEAWQRVQKNLEIDRSLRAFADAGVSVTYHACDVADRAALSKTLDAIRAADGPIDGILHGAGIDRSCRFDRKQREVVEATLGAKVDGAANLMALTYRDPVRHMIGFGSISGRLGSFGQTDYCLASDMLGKLVGAYRRERPWIHAVGFHWHPWDEVGMAARPETKNILQGKSDLTLMPLAEGIAHLLRELEAGCPEPEVLITERRHWQRFESGLGKLAASKAPGASAVPPAKSSPSQPAPAQSEAIVELLPEVDVKTYRCELRLIAAPLPPGLPAMPKFASSVWILGNHCIADELAARLQQAGVVVERLPNDDVQHALAEVDRLWSIRPAAHLFLLDSRDVPRNLLDAAAAKDARSKQIVLPFLVAQRWYKLLGSRPDLGLGTLAATVSLGGSFGFDRQAPSPAGGGISGLLKAVAIEDSRRETPVVRCKVLDAPPVELPATVVSALLAELASSEPEVEVAVSAGIRRVVRPIPVALPPAKRSIPRGGVWVVTGGARGITAIAARQLAGRYGWKLHLLGKSPAPLADAPWRNYDAEQMKALKTQLAREAVAAGRSPSAAWDRVMKDVEIFKNLEQIKAGGAQATYHVCDITDRQAVASALETIRRQDGPIDGVIHGAGLIDPGRFDNKRAAFVDALVSTKFDGALHLMALTQHDPLKYFIGFGSISGRFGGNGLTDYAAGNDALAKVIDWFRAARPDCLATCIHWESWEGSGMATQPRFAWGPKSVMNMKYMLPEEGVRRIEEELRSEVPNSEVLYTFGDFYPMFYPREQRPLGEFVPGALAVSAPATSSASQPLLGSIRHDDQGCVGDIMLDPTAEPFLMQHRLRNKPLLPVVVGLEALAEVAASTSGLRAVGFRNVRMLDGMLFHSEAAVVAQARATLTAGNTADCRLTCDFRNRSGGLIQKDRPYLQAAVELGAIELAPAPQSVKPTLPHDTSNIAWTDFAYPDGGMVYHGPALRGVNATAFNAAGGWGRIAAMPLAGLVGQARVQLWTVPSCVLDGALYACGIHLWVHGQGAISLPKQIDHLQLGRAARDGETCLVWFLCREITSDAAVYDFTLIGQDGELIAQARGYRKVILARGGGV